MWTVLLIFLILVAVGAAPTWPHSQGWGYYPSGGLLLLALILFCLLAFGPLPWWHWGPHPWGPPPVPAPVPDHRPVVIP